jgi:hypothetical protein
MSNGPFARHLLTSPMTPIGLECCECVDAISIFPTCAEVLSHYTNGIARCADGGTGDKNSPDRFRKCGLGLWFRV